MALTLDPVLLAAQTVVSRRPIVSLTSGRLAFDFPFVGTPIANPNDRIQYHSVPLFLSDGRFAIFYASDTVNYTARELHYIVSDSDGGQFLPYVTVANCGSTFTYIDGIVLNDDDFVIVGTLTNNTIVCYKVSSAGVKLSETIFASLPDLLGVSVTTTDTGYVIIYIQLIAGEYVISKRTSTDLITWSSATVIYITDLDITTPIQHPKVRRLDDGSYLFLFSYASLIDDDTIIYNIGSSLSYDLLTWLAIVPVTSTTTVSKDFLYPFFDQKSDETITVVAQEDNGYLTLTKDSPGWDTSLSLTPQNMWVDDVNGKLYVTGIWTGTGAKIFEGTVKIDIATWTIDKFYDTTTTPPVPDLWTVGAPYNPDQNPISNGIVTFGGGAYVAVCVVNYNTDTITGYYFRDYSATFGEEAEANVNHSLEHGAISYSAVHGDILWLGFYSGYLYDVPKVQFGYIDITDVTPPYDFTLVGTSNDWTVTSAQQINGPNFSFYPDDDLVLIACQPYSVNLQVIPLVVQSLVDGSQVKYYNITDYIEFPYNGVTYAYLVGDTIYAIPSYHYLYAPDAHKWGLLEIDINTDHMIYHYPPWLTGRPDEGYFRQIAVSEDTDELIIRTEGGAAIFNYVSKTWMQYEDDNIEGYPSEITDPDHCTIAYDSTNEIFFYGGSNALYYSPKSGVTSQIVYLSGTMGVSEWGFSADDLLAIGYTNTVPRVVVPPSIDIIYATWTNTFDIDNIYWDQQQAYLDLNEFLTGEIVCDMAIDDYFTLKFTLTNGHLFDPHNRNSILRTYISKGKYVLLQFGETVDDVDYLVNQGKYVIRGLKVKYQRDEYPLIEVSCEDVRSLWGIHQVVSNNVTLQTPEASLRTIILANTEIATEHIEIPSMPLSFAFDAQWVETYLQEIIDDISHRFQHFCCMDMDGDITFRPITLDGTSVNTHTVAQIIEYSPDDSYSDLTNRFTVTGESLNDFQILLAEERVGSLNGTVGWYGFKKDFKIWYSEDKSRRCKYPRIEVLESATSILFRLAGEITERISEVDEFDKYCVIEVKAPDLIPVLLAGIALYLAGNVIGDFVTPYMTIPFGRIIEGLGLYIVMMVLGSIGNFQYAIHAQPVGYAKRQYQATVDDAELQLELGQITEQKIEGFACYDTGDCEDVAEFELMVSKAQRSRLMVKKIAHLQDEIGDTVTVTHPYTNITDDIYITKIVRRYKQSAGNDDGYFIDEIEGWIA